MDERTVQRFWQEHACGDAQVGGLHDRFHDDYEQFFSDYDRFRYRNERHLPACVDALDVADKQVLEIGLGEGSESERLIRLGARWSGIDLTAESVARVRTRLALRDLRYEDLRQGSVLDLPFADNQFDLVFSHGVLHHVLDIKRAQREIHRVLRPGGELVIMMYARWSLNYLVSIGLIRRAALLAAFPLARGGDAQVRRRPGHAGRSPGQRQEDGAVPLPAHGRVHPPQHRRARPTRTRWCTTVGGSSETSRPSG